MLAYVTLFLQMLPTLIAAGQEIGAIGAKVLGVVQSKAEPTQADWDALAALEKPLRDALQTPLPPE